MNKRKLSTYAYVVVDGVTKRNKLFDFLSIRYRFLAMQYALFIPSHLKHYVLDQFVEREMRVMTYVGKAYTQHNYRRLWRRYAVDRSDMIREKLEAFQCTAQTGNIAVMRMINLYLQMRIVQSWVSSLLGVQKPFLHLSSLQLIYNNACEAERSGMIRVLTSSGDLLSVIYLCRSYGMPHPTLSQAIGSGNATMCDWIYARMLHEHCYEWDCLNRPFYVSNPFLFPCGYKCDLCYQHCDVDRADFFTNWYRIAVNNYDVEMLAWLYAHTDGSYEASFEFHSSWIFDRSCLNVLRMLSKRECRFIRAQDVKQRWSIIRSEGIPHFDEAYAIICSLADREQ